jgi:hypothetical protein
LGFLTGLTVTGSYAYLRKTSYRTLKGVRRIKEEEERKEKISNSTTF